MPVFASVAAYVVIDTFVLLIWHQILFVRVCRESAHLPQLKPLLDYYLDQCQLSPVALRDKHFLQRRTIAIIMGASSDTVI